MRFLPIKTEEFGDQKGTHEVTPYGEAETLDDGANDDGEKRYHVQVKKQIWLVWLFFILFFVF